MIQSIESVSQLPALLLSCFIILNHPFFEGNHCKADSTGHHRHDHPAAVDVEQGEADTYEGGSLHKSTNSIASPGQAVFATQCPMRCLPKLKERLNESKPEH